MNRSDKRSEVETIQARDPFDDRFFGHEGNP